MSQTYRMLGKKGLTGGTEERRKRENKRGILKFFSLTFVLSSPPFLRSSCSSSFDLGKEDTELV